MLKLQVLKLLVKSFMLTDFASVVVFFNYAHSAGNTRRIVTATFLTVDVEFSNDVVALWTIHFLFWFIVWWISAEKIDCKKFVSFSLRVGDSVESFELDEGSATFSEALVEEGSDRNKTVNIFSLQLFFIFNQPHSCFHGTVVIFLIELSLAEQIEMNGFCSFPRIC